MIFVDAKTGDTEQIANDKTNSTTARTQHLKSSTRLKI
tara:strand:- start:1368 stop:1481 length:114 start_codon:yes stop_codon:yes gene_type:complete